MNQLIRYIQLIKEFLGVNHFSKQSITSNLYSETLRLYLTRKEKIQCSLNEVDSIYAVTQETDRNHSRQNVPGDLLANARGGTLFTSVSSLLLNDKSLITSPVIRREKK